jgi:putative DNA methylase
LLGNVSQLNAVEQAMSEGKFISTDPPYYDNIGYAALSDFRLWPTQVEQRGA